MFNSWFLSKKKKRKNVDNNVNLSSMLYKGIFHIIMAGIGGGDSWACYRRKLLKRTKFYRIRPSPVSHDVIVLLPSFVVVDIGPVLVVVVGFFFLYS